MTPPGPRRPSARRPAHPGQGRSRRWPARTPRPAHALGANLGHLPASARSPASAPRPAISASSSRTARSTSRSWSAKVRPSPSTFSTATMTRSATWARNWSAARRAEASISELARATRRRYSSSPWARSSWRACSPSLAASSRNARASARASSMARRASSSALRARSRASAASLRACSMVCWRFSKARLTGGRTHLASAPSTARNATSSTTKVVLGTRKLEAASTVGEGLAGGEDEHEQGREGQVDEVHGLHQADDEEHGRVQAALDFGLAGDAGDRLAAGQAVADRRSYCPPAEGEASSGERTGELYSFFQAGSHWLLSCCPCLRASLMPFLGYGELVVQDGEQCEYEGLDRADEQVEQLPGNAEGEREGEGIYGYR